MKNDTYNYKMVRVPCCYYCSHQYENPATSGHTLFCEEQEDIVEELGYCSQFEIDKLYIMAWEASGAIKRFEYD